MSTTTTISTPTIAFFGATGGVTNSVLVHALRSGAHVTALARTPSKLIQQLTAQGLSTSTLNDQLTIIQGNALNTADVKATLTANHKPNHIVTHIVSGLGAAPKFQLSLLRPVTIDQPTICGDAATTLVTALTELLRTTTSTTTTTNPPLPLRKPKLSFVSTTGISTNGIEDVPCAMRPLYHKILAVPHDDKRKMEATFRGARDSVLSGVVGVRPTLLTGAVNADEGRGWEKIRAGKEGQPEMGWTVCRADVGQWMWENVVGDEKRRVQWEDEMVSLTN